MRIYEEAGYYAEKGISVGIVRRGNETFMAFSRLAEEDADVQSSFAGCEFALTKAGIKLLHHLYTEKRKRYETLTNLYTQLEQLREFDNDKATQGYKHIRKTIYFAKKEMDDAKEIWTLAKNGYKEYVEKRLAHSREIQKSAEDLSKRREFTRILETELNDYTEN